MDKVAGIDSALDLPVRLFPLTYIVEGDEVTVGNHDVGGFAVFLTDGAALARKLEEGLSPRAAAWYREQYGEAVDIADFLELLAELGLVRANGANTSGLRCAATGPGLVDSLVFLALNVGELVVVLILHVRERRSRSTDAGGHFRQGRPTSMNTATPQHIWIAGSLRRDRQDRALDREVLARDPVFLLRHSIAILSAAPELGTFLGASEQTLTSLASPSERTRFYSRGQNVAHQPWHRRGPAVALRRLPAEVGPLMVCGDPLPDVLAVPLDRYARQEKPPPRTPDGGHPNGDPEPLAASYIAGDCVSDDPDLLWAYDELNPARRAALHDERAMALSARGEPSLSRGAIPFHLLRGADPDGTRMARPRHAVDHLLNMGFYAATIELTEPGERFWWVFTTALHRWDRAEQDFSQVLGEIDEPEVHARLRDCRREARSSL